MVSDHLSDNIKVFSVLISVSSYILAHIEFKLVLVMLVHFCFCFINFIQLFNEGVSLLLLFIKVRGPNYFNFTLDYSI